ncbi:hypothetical protein D3C87_1639990 [compost metagenome]
MRVMLSEAEIAGRISSSRCCSVLQVFQSMMELKLIIVFLFAGWRVAYPAYGSCRPGKQNATGQHEWNYSIIFSIGSTRMELAPRAFSFSMVSQNRVSLLTMCIATRC